jgi:pilus assembly protein CpaE
MFNLNASVTPSGGAEAETRSTWLVQYVVPNRTVLDELAPIVMRCLPGTPMPDVRPYPDANEAARVIGAAPGTLCFLDAITDQARALSLIPNIVQACPGVQIIVLLSGNSPELVLRCLRLGAADFLLQPFTPDQLQGALAKLARMLPKDKLPVQSPAKVYGVMPAKGACGASTLACNLAFQLKRLGAKRVLMADLDALTGTVSFLLKIKSSYSFLDVLSRADTLDADLWGAMVTNRSGVDVLLAPESLVEGASELRDAAPIVEYARQSYDAIVLDASGIYGSWNLSQARTADEVLLITTNELAAVQSAQRGLAYLDSNRIGRWKTRVIVNRYDDNVGLTKDVIGAALETDVFHLTPDDPDAVHKALMEGKPVAPNTTIGKNLAALGERLCGKAQESPKRGSSLTGLLSLFSRTGS